MRKFFWFAVAILFGLVVSAGSVTGQDFDTLMNRGNASFDKRQYQEALSFFSKAIQIRPKSADAYISRGVAYANLGKNKSAIFDFNMAIELDPNFISAYITEFLSRH